jgi:hypothetical protein
MELPKFAEGSEHAVYLETSTSVLKLTRPGTYGESYYLAENGMVFQQSCWPLEYLIRIRLWDHIFGNAPRPVGITPAGQIVSRQPYIAGDPPSQPDVDEYLLQSGLEAVKQSRWLWKKSYPDEEYDVWVGDARNDNFVLTIAGMVPIDLRLWFNPGRPPR